MPSILVHYKQHKFLYRNETNFDHLRSYIREDVHEYLRNMGNHEENKFTEVFQLVYIDEEHGEWMVVQEQRDLDQILCVKKEENIILKLLPIMSEQIVSSSRKVPQKVEISQNMRKIGESLIQNYMGRWMIRGAIQDYLQQEFKSIQDRNTASQKSNQRAKVRKSEILDRQISRNLSKNKRQPHARISPQKKSFDINEVIQSKVKAKLNTLIPVISQQVYKNLSKQNTQTNAHLCKNSASKSLQKFSKHKQLNIN